MPKNNFWAIFGGFLGKEERRKRMRQKNYKGGRCTKRKLKKCEEVAKTYDKIQMAYADVLDRDPNIKNIRCNVPLGSQRIAAKAKTDRE